MNQRTCTASMNPLKKREKTPPEVVKKRPVCIVQTDWKAHQSFVSHTLDY